MNAEWDTVVYGLGVCLGVETAKSKGNAGVFKSCDAVEFAAL